jgi:hypothetical protein
MDCLSSKEEGHLWYCKAKSNRHTVDLIYKRYYDVARREDQRPDYTHFPTFTAQNIIDLASAPTHNRAVNTDRPHTHYSSEQLFIDKSIPPTPFLNVQPDGNQPQPVLWAYPVN